MSPAGVTTEQGTADGVVGHSSIRRLASGPILGAKAGVNRADARWGSWAAHLLLAAGRLCAPAAGPTRGRELGHQDLPLSRHQPLHPRVCLHVGSDRRPRDGYPPADRLPVPDGPLLLVLPHHRGPGMGGPAAVGRHDPLRRRGGRPLPVPDPFAQRSRALRGRVRLHVVAVLPPVRGADLGLAPPLGRAPLDGCARGVGRAQGSLAGQRPIRRRRGPGEQHQRHLAAVRRPWAGALARLRGRGPTRVDMAPGRRRGTEAGRIVPRSLLVVDRRARRRGRLRRRHPPNHRDGPDGQPDLHADRGAEGVGVLVLLRHRPPGPLGVVVGPVDPGTRPPGFGLRRARALLRRRGLHPLAVPGILRRCSCWWDWCSPSGPTRSPIPPGSATA